MAAPTKAQLATENAALHCRVAELEGEIEQIKERLALLMAVNASSAADDALAAKQHEERRRAEIRRRMAAAKAEAMRTGRTVRV